MSSQSQPSYVPEESPADLQLERMFVAADFICGVGYGVQVVLYTSCVLFLWRTRKQRGRQSLVLLSYMTLLLAIETLFCIVQAHTVEMMYIDNRNYPGGPWKWFLDTQYLAINVMFYATLFVLTFLADLLVLWRCWVIWRGSGKLIAYIVISFPALMLLASFVMGTLWTLQSSQPGLSLYSSLPMAYGTSYYVISLSVNIILTILITVRLLLYRRRAASIEVASSSFSGSTSGSTSDHGRHYFSLATIFVESAALYSVFALIFIVTYAVNDPLNQVFLGIASSAQIAGYLIIYRVAEGRAWGQGTIANQNKLQSLRFVSNVKSLKTKSSMASSHRSGTSRLTRSVSRLETPIDDCGATNLGPMVFTVSKTLEEGQLHGHGRPWIRSGLGAGAECSEETLGMEKVDDRSSGEDVIEISAYDRV